MSGRISSALILLAACAACSPRSSGSSESAKAAGGSGAKDSAGTAAAIEHRVTCDGVVAIWRGHREQGQDLYEGLELLLPGEKVARPFPHGEMYPSYWSFDIFAPDCRHVLLLPAYTGPYHVVRTSRLAAYLGGAAPDHVLAGRPGESGTVADGAWVSATEIKYQWGCCDPPVELRFTVRAAP